MRPALPILAALALAFSTQFLGAGEIQQQPVLAQRIEAQAPARDAYVKDLPILGWTISSPKLADIPAPIRDVLGAADSTTYDEAYLAENLGTIIALQMNKTGPDFYVIGKETYESLYQPVALDEVAAKNTRLMDRLSMAPDVKALFDARDPALTGALKVVPVEMIPMSRIGYDTAEEVTIQAPWGTQTKPAGQDAFLVWDTGENQYYMVNQDQSGLPMSYIPAK